MLAAASVALALLVAACSSDTIASATSAPTPSPSESPAASGPSTSVTATASGTPAATASPAPSVTAGASTVELTERNNGTALDVRRGQQIVVTLASTYWSIAPPSSTSVLRVLAGPVVSPRPGCLPGVGCGTVSATFLAVADGQTDVTASRTTCGEALLCTGSEGSWRVSVRVTG